MVDYSLFFLFVIDDVRQPRPTVYSGCQLNKEGFA